MTRPERFDVNEKFGVRFGGYAWQARVLPRAGSIYDQIHAQQMRRPAHWIELAQFVNGPHWRRSRRNDCKNSLACLPSGWFWEKLPGYEPLAIYHLNADKLRKGEWSFALKHLVRRPTVDREVWPSLELDDEMRGAIWRVLSGRQQGLPLDADDQVDEGDRDEAEHIIRESMPPHQAGPVLVEWEGDSIVVRFPFSLYSRDVQAMLSSRGFALEFDSFRDPRTVVAVRYGWNAGAWSTSLEVAELLGDAEARPVQSWPGDGL